MIDLPDINLWVALAYAGHAHYDAAQAWFATVPRDGAAFCRITQLGFLRLTTNSSVMEKEVLSTTEAWKAYDALRADDRIVFETEREEIETFWRAFARSSRSEPKRWADAYLAAFAAAGGFRLVSFDRGFNSFSDLNKLILHTR